MSQPAFRCRRCQGAEARLAHPPFPGALGQRVWRSTCSTCWAEWERREVIVINELRLNFMDPEAQEILAAQMSEFLALDSADSGGAAG
jgi:Fe-S cluster biosynthesis and repair protein YggX